MNSHHSRTPFQQSPATFSAVDYLSYDPHLPPDRLLTKLEHQLDQIKADRSNIHHSYKNEFMASIKTFSSLHASVSSHLLKLDAAKSDIQREIDAMTNELARAVLERKEKLMVYQTKIKNELMAEIEMKIKAMNALDGQSQEKWHHAKNICLAYERYAFVCRELNEHPTMELRAQLVSCLRVYFLDALKKPAENEPIASYCLEWSLRLSFQKDLIEWIKEKWIGEELSRRIQKQAFLVLEQEYVLTSSRQENGLVPIQKMVQSISRWMLDSQEWKSLWALLEDKRKDSRRVEFKFSVLKYTFEYVVQLLLSEIPLIFTLSGSTRYFHSNYIVLSSLIQFFEDLVPEEHRLTFRNLPSYSLFYSKWQLTGYFQLKLKDIIVPYEESLRQTFLNPKDLFPLASNEADKTSHSKVYQALMRAIQNCWSPDIVIDQLVPRFWKLTIQLMLRYPKWLKQYIEKIPSLLSLTREQKSAQLRQLHTELLDIDKDLWSMMKKWIQPVLPKSPSLTATMTEAFEEAISFVTSPLSELNERAK